MLAQWLLLSNVPATVDAGRLALWDYWRWRIESFFKLLKGAGQQVEHWPQESAGAVARRLLVVSAALVLVWQLGRAESPAAAELRTVLVRLSGRQIRRGRGWTTPALLEGVWVLLAMLELLEHYDLSHLRQLAETFFQSSWEKMTSTWVDANGFSPVWRRPSRSSRFNGFFPQPQPLKRFPDRSGSLHRANITLLSQRSLEVSGGPVNIEKDPVFKVRITLCKV